VAVTVLDEPADGLVGQVLLGAGLDHHAGAFVEQDPGDAGVELGQDGGDHVAADHPDAGDLVTHGGDLLPGRLTHRVRVRDRLPEVVGERPRVQVSEPPASPVARRAGCLAEVGNVAYLRWGRRGARVV